MISTFENGLFIFRRDLRIIDNIGLNLLNKHCKHIYTIFIFTQEQVGNSNKYKSNNAIQFMIESIEDLSKQINKLGGNLYTFYGHNEKVVADCIKSFNIDVVCFNLDITPYAKERDASIIQLCEKMKTYVMYDYDYYLHEPGSILNGTGAPYQKFTPYYNTAMRKKVEMPAKMRKISLKKSELHIPNQIRLDTAMKKMTNENPNILVHGGRIEALNQLKIAAKNIRYYSKTHNELSNPTSQLSAYIKFGCISIREVYKVFHSNHDFIRQLVWRDFYANILYSFPHVLGNSMKTKYDNIKWHYNDNWFKSWCKGTTGFPVVDAGMRQINKTGYMHNRARLIVMSFLIKTLLIDWRKGETYFATKLTDYDPASNNGNIQWVSGSGADSQQWMRIFNPWIQSEEYDNDCIYIKYWIPELKDVPNKDIHRWNTEYVNYKSVEYFKPICDYSEQREKAFKMYKDALY